MVISTSACSYTPYTTEIPSRKLCHPGEYATFKCVNELYYQSWDCENWEPTTRNDGYGNVVHVSCKNW